MSVMEALLETDKTIINRVKKIAEPKGFKVMDVRKVDNNPNNDYLRFALSKSGKDEYCTHIVNLDANCIGEGQYDLKTYEKGLDNLYNRK